MIDIDTMTLPNSLTQSGLILGFIYQASLASTNSGDRTNLAGHLINGVFGAVLGLCSLEIMLWLTMIFLVISLVPIIALEIICRRAVLSGTIVTLLGKIWQREAMGGGDFKLMSMIGVWLGWQKILLVILVSSAIGVFIGLIGKLMGKIGRFTEIPFGLSLSIAAALSLFFGDGIISNYLDLFGLFWQSH